MKTRILTSTSGHSPLNTLSNLEPTLATSISNTIAKYSLQHNKSDHSAPPIPAELTTGFRLLGSPVGSPTFAREFFNDKLSNVQTSITLLSAAITDPQTKLRLFLQCLIQKLPHLLDCDVLYHFDPNDTPPDWTDWLGGTFRISFHFFGCRNPGPDSCSSWIPAESNRNIPDVPPFLRAGTLLP